MTSAITGAAIGFLVWVMLTGFATTQFSRDQFPYAANDMLFKVFTGSGAAIGRLIGGGL